MSHDVDGGRLLLGQFSTSSGADICAVSIDEEGRLDEVVEQWTLPIAKVQGALSLSDGRILLSQSYSTADSALYIWTPGESAATLVLTGPSGLKT